MSTCGGENDGVLARKRIRVSVVSMCSTKMELRVDGCTVAQVNALRRACLADVPVLAIDETQVHANTTGVHDETIGHRLGFVPLRHATNPLLEGMCRKGACTCRDACPMCEFPLAVHFKAADETSGRQVYRKDGVGGSEGHGNDGNTHCCGDAALVAMTSRHIRCNASMPVVPVHCTQDKTHAALPHKGYEGYEGYEGSEDKLAPNTPIKGTGHRILQAAAGTHFTSLCKARMGTAADGAKWSAVSLCAFRKVETSIDYAGSEAGSEAGSGQTFCFTVETTGQLTPQEVLHSAMLTLRQRLGHDA